MDVNGSYRSLLSHPRYDYIAADLVEGDVVTLVLDDPHKLPLEDSSVDLVLSGQILEHCEFFWLTFAEMVRVLKEDGLIFLIAPSAGAIHRYPVDCYRFYPDAYRALAKYAGCHLVDSWMDERGPWRDLVGVFSRPPMQSVRRTPIRPTVAAPPGAPARTRGVPFLKSPFDIGIYLQLLPRLSPRTVIEIGAKHGGSALWFADMLSAAGASDFRIVSVDIDPKVGFSDPRIHVLQGDAARLGETLTPDRLAALPRPWLVVEDSSHRYEDVLAVLTFFHRWTRSGDYVVVEDGVVSQFVDRRYAEYEDGPNRAVRMFVERHPDDYELDTALCDHYGRNLTYNPNGWLRRV